MENVGKIRIVAMILLTALLVPLSNQPGPNSVKASVPHGSEITQTTDPFDPMFPDGFDYDFGDVPRETTAYHAFRIVNTTRVPLQIVSLRRSG